MSGSYLADAANQILFLVCLSVSLNLLVGFAGQLSMATAAFYGIGAYACGIMTATGQTLTGTDVIGPGWPFWAGLLTAIAAAFVSGTVIAVPAARRVKGDYLILLTLAFQFLIMTGASSWVELTGGPNGMTVPPIAFGSVRITSTDQAFVWLLVLSLAISLLCWFIGASPYGRLLRGIREDELMVQALGKGTIWPKTLTFGITAAVAGGVGAISAAYTQFVAPTTYSLDLAILATACVALGGPGNIAGSAIAAVIIGGLRPFLESVMGLSDESSFPWQAIIYGVVLVLGMRFRPTGLLPEYMFAPRAAEEPALDHSHPMLASQRPAPSERYVNQPPVLNVSGVSKAFGGIKAVQSVSFQLHRGEIVALIGPNGAGKTTVFNLLTGAMPADEGEVTLHGKPITNSDQVQIARTGMVRFFQNVRLFAGITALDNVALAVPQQDGESLSRVIFAPWRVRNREREVREQALQQLDFCGVADLSRRIVRDLSFGQQKLIALARLLASGGDVLLLDEPVSGVDPRSAEQMIALIRGLAESGKAICIVEHSLHVVSELADRVVFMDAGQVVAEGSVEAITARADLIDLYFGT
jgi:branched-chain amino acid transport system permease protein